MTRDMTSGRPLKLILAFCLPLMLGSLFQQLYNMVDTIIVGRFVGVDALAAVGSTGSLNYLVIGAAIGMCSGFSIPLAQAFGARDGEALRRYTANIVWLTAGFGVALTVITIVLTRQILVWMQTPEDIFDLAFVYMVTIFAGIPATLLYNTCSAIMRAMGDSRHPLYFLVFASILNVVLDFVLILNFDAGVFGAALATIISQAVSGVVSAYYLIRHFPELHWKPEEGKISSYHCKKLCAMGLPMGLQCTITALGSVVLQAAVNGLGSSIVAAQTAGSKASLLLNVPLESMGNAMTTYTGQNLGARRLDRVREGIRKAILVDTIYSAVVFLALQVIGTPLVELFVDASETAIVANARYMLTWYSGFYFFLGTLMVYRFGLQGMGFSTLAMFAGVAEMLARGLVGFLLVGSLGYLAACLASPVAWVAACIFLFPAYHWAMHHLEQQIKAEKRA